MESIMRCFGASPVRYQAIHKKDDDISEELATIWVSSHPIRKDLSTLPNEAIQAYVTQLIQALKKVSINPSNTSIITIHLLEISTQSERARRDITEKLSKLSCDRSFIGDLQFRLALVYSKNM